MNYWEQYVNHSEQDILEIHLQWFAAEDEGRTEDPTEHKIRKAREEGKVAKSQEVSGSVVLLFPVIALAILGPYLISTMFEMVGYFLRQAGEIDITKDGGMFRAFYGYFIRLTLPIAAVSFVSALIGNILQVGFLFTVKPITPDLNKIVPKFGKFFQRAFASTEALFNLAKSIIKIVIIGVLAYINISSEIDRIINLIHESFVKSAVLISSIAFRILIEAAVILLAFSLFDYMFQRRQHIESLKMSKQEVKEERKTYEGDPLVRSRMRERMREILSSNMIQAVPNADVVITNPTHFAVALEYRQEAMHAPKVSAKGQDELALRIRSVAEENEVPIVENKPLARALYAEVEIGDTIPEQYYQVVATILSQVYTMQGNEKVG